MKQISQQTPQPSARLQMSYRLREGLLILSAAVSLFLILAFSTYHASDAAWSTTGDGEKIINSGGAVGAFLADILLSVFGYMAYLFPVMLVFAAWLGMRVRTEESKIKFHEFSLRALGFILTLVTACGFISVFLPYPLFLPTSAGGILGDLIGFHLVHIFNFLGTGILLLAFLLCGVTLFTGLSWFFVLDTVGQALLTSCQRLLEKYETLKVKYVKKKDVQKIQPLLYSQTAQTPIHPVESEEPGIKINVLPTYKPHTPIFATPDKSMAEGLPPLHLLNAAPLKISKNLNEAAFETLALEVERHLNDFDIVAKVTGIHPGPIITRFELQLAPGIKVSKITGLSKDLARSLSVPSVRIVEIIPGKPVIGLEIPNIERDAVALRDVLEATAYQQAKSPISLALGKDIAGNPVVVDLSKMPHLLVAGTTGAGKSVSLNVMLLSILYKATPEEVRLILIDPKMLELSVYEGIPHLLTPVITDMKEAANALRWCAVEMDRRYRLMAHLGVRNLGNYNHKVKEAIDKGEPLMEPAWTPHVGTPGHLETMPLIVVIIDELADMMMLVGKKVEETIARIAQKARAAGIHLILATQRPSVDVITGLIKANIPTRIAFQVSSRIDSRTILDQQGAEQLLGHGDMLYLPPGTGIPIRVHGAFVGDDEVHQVVAAWKNRGEPRYLEEILDPAEAQNISDAEEIFEADPLYDQAVRIVTESRRASVSSIQRRLKIGYNRAARMVEDMERAGIVSSMETNGTREVIAPPPPD